MPETIVSSQEATAPKRPEPKVSPVMVQRPKPKVSYNYGSGWGRAEVLHADGTSTWHPLTAGAYFCFYMVDDIRVDTDVPNLMLQPVDMPASKKPSGNIMKKPAVCKRPSKRKREETDEDDEDSVEEVLPAPKAPVAVIAIEKPQYHICYYRKDNTIGIKTASVPHKQVLSFGRGTINTDQELRDVAGKLLDALAIGTL